MKRFNPDKELNKIRNGNKNKLIIGIITLLLIITIGSTYALYQVRHTNKLAHIIVQPFYQNDLDLAVYVDGVKKITAEEFPTKDSGTNLVYTGIKCEDGKEVKASWDYDKWSLDIESKLPNKCNVYFETKYRDKSGANYPELYQGLIPVYYDNNQIIIADITKDAWYDYNEHKWANAILVDYNNPEIKNKFYERDKLKTGTIIDENDILQMYVWIPRYKYQLFNASYGLSEAQAISIIFESSKTQKSTGQKNKEWLTHPAFTFGETELSGIWVGKFEPSGTTDNIKISPNSHSLTNVSIKDFYYAGRNIENKNNKYNLSPTEVDTHMMKNMEWGAVAYLSSSIYGRYNDKNGCGNVGCEIWVNNTATGSSSANRGTAITGCSGKSVNELVQWNSTTCLEGYDWRNKGVNASTTGNIYGIYDMAGGEIEFVMGAMATQDGYEIYSNLSGFDNKLDTIETKYYDLYRYSNDPDRSESSNGHLGDATRETLSDDSGIVKKCWDSGGLAFVNDTFSWFRRGANAETEHTAGIFNYSTDQGGARDLESTRFVIVSEDNG